MANFQHPTQLIKSQDTIIYVGTISGASRPTISSPGGAIALSGVPSMKFLPGVTEASLSLNDTEQEYYILGGGGFADAINVTSRAELSITTYFQRDVDGTTLQAAGLDEAIEVIATSRYDKNAEIFVQVFKALGATNYDATMFSAAVQGYSESYPADNLVQLTFNLVSRGPIAAGSITLSGASMLPTNQNS